MRLLSGLVFPVMVFAAGGPAEERGSQIVSGETTVECDILIVGGGVGGVAAALQACAMAEEFSIRKIILTEETDWLGGQYTSQGVTAADDNPLVVQGKYTVGASELYFRFHETIRGFYRSRALETAQETAGPDSEEIPPRSDYADWVRGPTFSPGNPWGSRMSFLPADSVRAIETLLDPYVRSGLLEVRLETVPVEVMKEAERVVAVRFRRQGRASETVDPARTTPDATDQDVTPPEDTEVVRPKITPDATDRDVTPPEETEVVRTRMTVDATDHDVSPPKDTELVRPKITPDATDRDVTPPEKTEEVRAKITLDATELGDLLPLAGAGYRVGIEASADTNEPSLFDAQGKPLYPEPLPGCTQAFTYTFAVEWRPPGEDHRRSWDTRPASYEASRHRYSLVDSGRWFLMTRWNDFAKAEAWARTEGQGPFPYLPPFWTYRRMYDAMVFDPRVPPELYPRFLDGEWRTDFDPKHHAWFFRPNDLQTHVGDIIEVNWISNDYAGESIIDVPPEERERILERARELSLGFLYWLWYEVPRDPEDPRLDPSQEKNWSLDPATGKNRGYANLRFRPDVMGTANGLSKFPYIRESRRLRALRTVLQQDLMGPTRNRARLFHDSVGIGQYSMDVHPCDLGSELKRDIRFKWVRFPDGSEGTEASCRRYQIPWGAMVPEKIDGLIPAAKNIGTTHISASAYRLHPVEFQIGQAAGAAAALCVSMACQPRDLYEPGLGKTPGGGSAGLRRLQWELLRRRTALFWNEDSGWDSADFVPIQWVCLLGILDPHGERFDPDAPLTRREAVVAAARLVGREGEPGSSGMTRFDDITLENRELASAVTRFDSMGSLEWVKGESFLPDLPITPAEFQALLDTPLRLSPDGAEEGGLGELVPPTGEDRGRKPGNPLVSRQEAAQALYRAAAARFGLRPS